MLSNEPVIMSFLSSKKNWEGFAQNDPLWSICTNPLKKGGKWDLDEFFEMGKTEVDSMIGLLQEKNYLTAAQLKCLDFGCGVGRLSRALSNYFNEVVGLDVSATMIQKAKEFNKDFAQKLSFIHNESIDLLPFDDSSFDFVFSSIVLQHIPKPASINYINEFTRICKPDGLIVFQLPVEDIRKLSLLQQLQSKIKIRERLALLGLGSGFQMEMHTIPEEEVIRVIESANCQLLEILNTNHTDPSFDGEIIFNHETNLCFGYISELFIIRKKDASTQF